MQSAQTTRTKENTSILRHIISNHAPLVEHQMKKQPMARNFSIWVNEAPYEALNRSDLEPLLSTIKDGIFSMDAFIEDRFRIFTIDITIDISGSLIGAFDIKDSNYHAGWNPNTILFTLPDSSINFEYIKVSTTHESAHAFESQLRTNKMPEWLAFSAVFEKIRSNAPNIFKLFTESTYPDTYSKAGHPHDNSRELFASTSTIMIWQPEEFMQRVSALDSYERGLALQVAGFVLGEYFKQNQEAAKELFNPRLVHFINSCE